MPTGGRPAEGMVPSVPEGGGDIFIGGEASGLFPLRLVPSTGLAGAAPKPRTGRGGSVRLGGGVSGLESCAAPCNGVNAINRAMAIFVKMVAILAVSEEVTESRPVHPTWAWVQKASSYRY